MTIWQRVVLVADWWQRDDDGRYYMAARQPYVHRVMDQVDAEPRQIYASPARRAAFDAQRAAREEAREAWRALPWWKRATTRYPR